MEWQITHHKLYRMANSLNHNKTVLSLIIHYDLFGFEDSLEGHNV